MTPDDVLMIAAPATLLSLAAVGALYYRSRTRRLESAPVLRPSQLAAGAVPEGTRVQLTGVAAGEATTAPWSGARCVAWAHTFTLTYKEETPHGVRDAGVRVEQREGGAWGLSDGAQAVEVRAVGGRARWLAGSPVACNRWDVSDRAGPADWRVGAVAIAPPSWRYVPGGFGFELHAEERVVGVGEALVVVGLARCEGGRWRVELCDDDCAITQTGVGEVTTHDRRVTGLFVGVGAVVVLAAIVGVAVALGREDGCVGVITPPTARPAICCVPATGARAAEIRVLPGEREAVLRVTGAVASPRIRVGEAAEVAGDTVSLPASATPLTVRVTSAGGEALPRFCARVEAR